MSISYFVSNSSYEPRTLNNALTTIRARLIIPTDNLLLKHELKLDQINQPYLMGFNSGSHIYQQGIPFSIGLCDNFQLYKKNYESYNLLDKWPKCLQDQSLFVGKSDQNLLPLTSLFGPRAKTFLDTQDLEMWTVYWAIQDIIKGTGAFLQPKESRVPERFRYLHAYDVANWQQDFQVSFTKEEAQEEIQRSMLKNFQPIQHLWMVIENWINQSPDSFYSVYFHGTFLIIDRLPSFSTFFFLASKEQNPMLERLIKMQP